jgi:hypothetical protein
VLRILRDNGYCIIRELNSGLYLTITPFLYIVTITGTKAWKALIGLVLFDDTKLRREELYASRAYLQSCLA